MKTFPFVALLAGLVLSLAPGARAQVTAMPGTGCPGVAPPNVVGPPSHSSTFQIDCGPADSDTLCLQPPVLLVGGCLPGALPILPPLGCDPGCSLVVSPVYGTFASPLVLVPPSLPSGFTFCVQCGCIADYGVGACIELSEGITITMMP
ncbi:MAG: hypothetical protein KDB80_06095 [Planctomycetes bacterium]|nr:hypothetical protein [Planctomycetota bacterium]